MIKIPGFSSLYNTDGYKIGHKQMLALNTTRLYGTWIPRSTKYAPKDVNKIVSALQQVVVIWLHEEFQQNFFNEDKDVALKFGKDMTKYLNLQYNGKHFETLYDLGYLPIQIQSLPEGIETLPNIPHMTFINTVDGFGWLTLYLETFISSLAWKGPTSATLALQYRRVVEEWVMKTDPDNSWLIPFLCHDFSARGLDPYSQITSGLGYAFSFMGSDTLPVIPAARFFYNNKLDDGTYYSTDTDGSSPKFGYFKTKGGEIQSIGIEQVREGGWVWIRNNESPTLEDIDILKEWPKLYKLVKNAIEYESVSINSVNASEHSVSTTKIFTVGEKQMIIDWLKEIPEGIFSMVCDTFSTWQFIDYLRDPEIKSLVENRKGKLVVRPDSGDPVDIICGLNKKPGTWNKIENNKYYHSSNNGFYQEDIEDYEISEGEYKGVIELLGDIFGYTINEQGYKVLPSYIGAIYGDSITLERQTQIYERLADKGWAATNIVLGVGSYTFQYNTRDTFGFAAKGAWFEILEEGRRIGKNIYKDPITDYIDGKSTKKSLKGFQFVYQDKDGEYRVLSEVSEEKAYSDENILQTIYKDGEYFNQVTLDEIRERINKLI